MTYEQSGSSADVNALQQHLNEIQLRASDLKVRLDQLREQQARAGDRDRSSLNQSIAQLQHDYTATMIDMEMAKKRLVMMEAGTTVPPPHDPLIDRSMLEKTGTGVFLLMIPIVFALARRIWVRSGSRVQPVIDLESSPRMQRLEEAIESIAIEVERIGEAQRFATKLLTERPEPAVNRASAAPAPIARKTPGTITPH
ncbi:MAG: hypothetical protein JWL61_1535 [Gemmatimonadetes bacterium]|nr:hypothetical protein [Gemmatimonadota bacterium]